MRILFLLSNLEPTGSEMYCLTLAKAWEGRYPVFWISDKLFSNQPYTALPMHRKAFPGGLMNTWRVRQFVRHHHIQIIHSHSRRANWGAAQVSSLTGVPYVTTIHQAMPAHFFSRTFPCLGHQAIAVDENVSEQMRRDFEIPSDRIRLIRNPINPDMYPFVPKLLSMPEHGAGDFSTSKNYFKEILVIGRLSGGRWRAFQFFLQALRHMHARLPPARYRIVGRLPEDRRREVSVQLAELNRLIGPSKVEMTGYVPSLSGILRGASGVIAAGRSALESLCSGKPVLILGEGGTQGLCTSRNWEDAMRTNFGDHTLRDAFDRDLFETSLHELLSTDNHDGLVRWGRAQVMRYYNVEHIAREIESVYRWAISRS